MHTKRSERNAGDDLPDDDDIDEEERNLDDDDAPDLDDNDDGDDDDSSTDNVGDLSVELNVEELMAQLESAKSDDIARKKEIRRRLEEIQERRSLDDTYSFDMYNDD